MQNDLGTGGAVQISSGVERICGPGVMADLIRTHHWMSAGLGCIAEWPDALVVLINMMLANQHPMILFWGDGLTQFYNDAAIPILGPDKHPQSLGRRGDESWAEVWHVVGHQIESARQGTPIWNEDFLAPIFREGHVSDAWFTYSYSPVRDGSGQITGVLVTCLETTQSVLARQSFRAEQERLLALFQQAPAFFAVLRGPDHVYELTNPPYQRLISGRNVIGKKLRDVLPEAVEQGYEDVLNRVYRTGEPFIGNDVQFTFPAFADRPEEVRSLDFVYQPLREPDGSVSGILVLGVDTTERKRTLEALLATEKSAATVLEAISDGFHVIDNQGRFQNFNPAGRAIYESQGLDADELIGRSLHDVFPGIENSDTGRALVECLHTHQPTTVEGCYRPWNRWFSVRNYPTPDGGVATFFQDITERRQTEDQLSEQRERFEFATRAAQIGYWFCNLPFDKLDWDDTVKEHFWLPPDAKVDIELFYQRIHPDDRERTRVAIETSIATNGRYDIEYRTVSPDGACKWIRAIGRTAYNEDGSPARFDGVTQDITALKKVTEALDAERARLSAVFENVPVGLLFTLADGRIVSGNRQAERILGRSFSHEGSETYRDLHVLHADGTRVEVGDRPLTLALAEGGIHRGEYQYVRPDGSCIWVEMIGAPILDAQGKIIGAVDAFADIDVRKRAETALIRSEKLALVGRLAASISHEINNPLEAVTNLLYLIENNTKDATARNFSRTAQDELARVSHIVTHTLRFNRQTVALGEQKMSGLLESSVAIYEGRLKNSGVSLDRDYADTSRVFCSGSEIRQVFANVVGNSFDATKTGGRLVLRTRDQRHWRTGQPGVRVTIADTGHGMPEEVRRRLFEPFFTTKGDNGTGLGLWVSREIIAKHHSRMRVKSRQGDRSGTVFSIWFPLNAVAQRTPEIIEPHTHAVVHSA
ncbi:PAS domain-containing sensor histidine kinase [Occallatibacter riparius]|uniref:histidine kinase n=1 Tax=Occallatibacter riparius TaxID=1002689 RepID=A0A9J7BNR2_9BACT|nr:PAS domain-containing protein [Occallatibacter riparius]UWZ82550.1 PAS domain-containing protein [Occallatibacter riparius]